jgi:hypothetical protein
MTSYNAIVSLVSIVSLSSKPSLNPNIDMVKAIYGCRDDSAKLHIATQHREVDCNLPTRPAPQYKAALMRTVEDRHHVNASGHKYNYVVTPAPGPMRSYIPTKFMLHKQRHVGPR